MTTVADDGRHLTRSGLQQYLTSGGHAVIQINGVPEAYLVVDPVSPKLSLRTPLMKNRLPDLSRYENLKGDIAHWQDRSWCQISAVGEVVLDALPLLQAIADRVQLQGIEFSRATIESLDMFSELLSGAGRLSDEQEAGLFGELLLLEHLLSVLPNEIALHAWQGPLAAEHDFDIGHADVEVKTTLSESRHHWISSVTQLTPTIGRTLWLSSIQLTGAGADGRTLPELISQIDTGLEPAERPIFQEKLDRAGWRNAFAPHHHRKMRLRTAPALFEVDDMFPALTRKHLSVLNLESPILQLRYLLDLTSLRPAAEIPASMKNFG